MEIEEIPEDEAVEVLMDELKRYPFINSAEIMYGGFFDNKKESRFFSVERMHDHIPQRILVQQFLMEYLNEKSLRDMIDKLEIRVSELKEQLKGFE